jgi:hypothetical protein
MLHRYAFTNFQSFRDRTEVSWLLDRKASQGIWARSVPTGERVSLLMSVLGANASGKTALLKPVVFLSWFVSHSFGLDPQAPLPLQAHLAEPDAPSEFEVDFDADDKLWHYQLRCTPARVLHESLHVRHERMRYVFVRDWDEAQQRYEVKQRDFGLLPAEARKVRPNASLIATAAQYGVPLAQRLSCLSVFSNIDQMGRRTYDHDQLLRAAQHFAGSQSQRDRMVKLLRSWDLGLKDVELRELENVEPDGTRHKYWLPLGIHATRAAGQSFAVPFPLESSGTQSAMVLLSRLLPALEQGGLAVIDELENDLHPHMLEPILGLFASPESNPLGAQLLFTSHAVEVLNILHKPQVMLVEKDEANESLAWRLDSMGGVRSDDNLYAKYMAGAYGAVPQT